MKKGKILAWVAALCAATLLTGLLAACDDGGENNGGEPQTYTVTAAESEDYTLTPDKTSAAAGDTVTVTAEMKNADKYITGVKYNEEDCGEEDGKYTFTMPAENVTLSAVTEAYAEVLEDGFMSFATFTPDTIAVYENEFDNTDALNFTFSEIIQVSEDEVVLASSNQNVIPDSALRVWLDDSAVGGGTGKNGGKVYISVNDIQPGTAYITVTVKDHTTRDSATVVKKITVVEEGTLEIPTMKVTLTFDISKAYSAMQEFSDDFMIILNDQDLLWGASNNTNFNQTFSYSDIEDSSEIVITMENFAMGHGYSVGIQYNGEYGKMSLKFDELINADGSFDGHFLTLHIGEAVEFGPITAQKI